MKIEKKIQEPIIPPPEYMITLSKEEAIHLVTIAGYVTGAAPEKETLFKLYDMLRSVGIEVPYNITLAEYHLNRKT